jgi:bilin biosynthesis protein
MTTDSLFEQLKHPNPNLRERAMVEIAQTRNQETIPRLMSILGEEDVTYRRSAVKALGYIGPDSVASLVKTLLESDNTIIRSSCAKGLAQVAYNHPDLPFPVEGMEGLKIAIHDPNPVVHIASVMALGEIGLPALDILLDALKTTENLGTAVAMINAISAIPDPRVSEVLTQLANDQAADTYIRESATSALSRLEQVLKRY